MSGVTLGDILPWIISALGVTGVVGWFKLGPERDDLQANAQKTMGESWDVLVKNLNDQQIKANQRIAELETKVDSLESENEQLHNDIKLLIATILSDDPQARRDARVIGQRLRGRLA